MSFSAAATMRFDGTQHLGLFYGSGRVTEAEDLSFRFRTLEKDAFVVATRDSTSPDRLQITLGMLNTKIRQVFFYTSVLYKNYQKCKM